MGRFINGIMILLSSVFVAKKRIQTFRKTKNNNSRYTVILSKRFLSLLWESECI